MRLHVRLYIYMCASSRAVTPCAASNCRRQQYALDDAYSNELFHLFLLDGCFTELFDATRNTSPHLRVALRWMSYALRPIRAPVRAATHTRVRARLCPPVSHRSVEQLIDRIRRLVNPCSTNYAYRAALFECDDGWSHQSLFVLTWRRSRRTG